MTTTLTRDEIARVLDRFSAGEIGERALAAWAFDQFYAAEEAQIVYEPGYEELIAEMLDEIMWSDSPPFQMDVQEARRLRERLDGTR